MQDGLRGRFGSAGAVPVHSEAATVVWPPQETESNIITQSTIDTSFKGV